MEKYRFRSRCNAPRPNFCVYVFQTAREGERLLWVDAALCTVDRDSQVRSKEVVYRAINFWGMWLEFETRRMGRD
jgi:hypothetical protein